jgi:hypothetical protein
MTFLGLVTIAGERFASNAAPDESDSVGVPICAICRLTAKSESRPLSHYTD